MRLEEYDRMYALENTYWWYQGRKEIVLQMLRRHTPLGREPLRVLDVGCGTGLLLQELAALAGSVGVDFESKALEYCKKRGLLALARAQVEHLPFGENRFDLLLALDLFEHVDDDAGLLRECHRVLKPGGHLLITVPAYHFLWSDHDEALHHRRRYSRAELRALLGKTDLDVVRFSSAITSVLPPVAVFRWIRRRFRPRGEPRTHLIRVPRAMNQFLYRLLCLESWLLRYIDFPAGVTILALLRKPERPRRD